MTSTINAAAALIADLAAIACPVDRAAQVSLVAKQFGNLPPALARVRREALREARIAGRRVTDIAKVLGLSRGRIYDLTRPAAEGA